MLSRDLKLVPNGSDDRGLPHASDLRDEQRRLVEPLLVTPHKRGPRFHGDLWRVVNTKLSNAHSGW